MRVPYFFPNWIRSVRLEAVSHMFICQIDLLALSCLKTNRNVETKLNRFFISFLDSVSEASQCLHIFCRKAFGFLPLLTLIKMAEENRIALYVCSNLC